MSELDPANLSTTQLLVALGLGTPLQRGITGAVLVGTAAYLARWPAAAFTEDGELRPPKYFSPEPDATYKHFLLVPLTAGAVFFLFT